MNAQFQSAVALAKNGADGNQAQVDQVMGNIASLESQVTSKAGEEKSLYAQRDNLTRAYNDLSAKVDDKLGAEQDADRALADGAKKDPPPSASDLQSLEQASAAARQERENTEAERSNFWLQIVTPADQAYWAKVSESIPLKKQLSGLKQQRDTLMLGLNKARTALAELNQEYQEPSL